MDEDLYDEFGNYIGDDPGSDEGKAHEADHSYTAAYLGLNESATANDGVLMQIDSEEIPQDTIDNEIVLHEDKKYYPGAAQVYGNEVETLVQEEDTQPLTEPLVKPTKTKVFTIEEEDLPEVRFDRSFMLQTMSNPAFMRNIAVIGHLHHGKTALIDMLVKQSHIGIRETGEEQLRYTDTHELERQRKLSIKATPITLLLPNTKGKSLVCNFVDTPGHVNFMDEIAVSMQLVDGVILVVDAAEGFMPQTQKLIHQAINQNLAITLVINKIDRLILELRLPPGDAYFKLKSIIEEVNNSICVLNRDPLLRVSPERGNVCFASAKIGWIFSLHSFSKFYAGSHRGLFLDDFSQRLWGDIYYDPTNRTFSSKPVGGNSKRSFVHFVLEPIYKLFSQTISAEASSLRKTLGKLGIVLKPAAYKTDVQKLLQIVCGEFFGPATSIVDMVFEHVRSPLGNARSLVEKCYTGPLNTKYSDAMLTCDPSGPQLVMITKLISSSTATSFSALGRVMSGTLRRGDPVSVLGENYTLDDEEDMASSKISTLALSVGRYRLGVETVGPGCIVLIDGIDASISKTATLVSRQSTDDAYIFRPVQHFTESVVKIAVEPINPSELPKMLDGLRKINKSYPLAVTKVEESGEHILLGTGELYLDCMLHDLRKLYSEIDIKISDPVTRFCETIMDTSAIKCYAETPNKKNKITMIAEPMDDGLASDIELEKLNLSWPVKRVSNYLHEKYHWDVLASRSVWAFGPDDQGPNILQNDTLPSETDINLLGQVRESIRQGFQWGTREGPLCDEPIRNTKFKILDTVLAAEPIFRGGGQIIPTARRVCYSSFLMGNPRLMEPVFEITITAPADCVPGVYNVLSRRRGHITKEIPIAGTPLYYMTGLVPVIDSFGLETDLRSHTRGQAFCQQHFDHWQIVPGDPLDKSIKIRTLESASAQHMARDFMIKTRRRKGLNEDVSIRKYIDDEMRDLLIQSQLFEAANI